MERPRLKNRSMLCTYDMHTFISLTPSRLGPTKELMTSVLIIDTRLRYEVKALCFQYALRWKTNSHDAVEIC